MLSCAQLKADVLRIWIQLILIGLFASIEIECCRDVSLAALETCADSSTACSLPLNSTVMMGQVFTC